MERKNEAVMRAKAEAYVRMGKAKDLKEAYAKMRSVAADIEEKEAEMKSWFE